VIALWRPSAPSQFRIAIRFGCAWSSHGRFTSLPPEVRCSRRAWSNNRDASVRSGRPAVSVATQLPVSDTAVKFVFVAPQAEKVSLVGDFNGWDTTKTPMVRVANGGVWTVTLPLTAGRHLYSFVVDGSAWSTDPTAPVAADDGFGHANSVKIVSRGAAL
jgi:1,4-alpha-glucan branching enzyme